MRKENWFRGALLSALFFVLLAAATAGSVLVAQNEGYDLRLWLIDRIEDAYVRGDTEALRRMADAEYRRDVSEWLNREADGLTSIVQAMGGGPGTGVWVCPEGQTVGESMLEGWGGQMACFDENGLEVGQPEWLEMDLDPIELPEPPAPPPAAPLPPSYPPNAHVSPLPGGLCTAAWKEVAKCVVEEELLCALADEDEEENELDEACDAKRTYCAGLALNATIVCAGV